uniref:ferric-chelate reductase (NADH) n=1 Tax=Kalanchoe fedtschenkoi TaxID=63787 RepID=A0A7N0RHH6_KALFE
MEPKAIHDQGGVRAVRDCIKALIVVVLLGYALVWIMIPTNTYRKDWQVKIRAKTNNSTFLGSQGANTLLFTSPMLFVAVLGCVYIHLGKKLGNTTIPANSESKLKQRLAQWKRPALVKGPLGIVSAVELAFLGMFASLLIWSLYTYLHNGFGRITPESLAKSGEKRWEAKLEVTGLRLGLLGNVCLALLFYPVARGSSILGVFGLTSESSIKYHIWLGHVMMAIFTAHGLCYVIYWTATHELHEMLSWETRGVANVPGELALIAGLILWACTLPRIRRRMFELFFYTHYLYILFMFFFILHVGIGYATIMLPGFYLFLVDRYIRFLQSRGRVRLAAARVLPCDTIELNFAKNPAVSYTPTSTIFVNVPSISRLQWHPFTISSSSSLEAERLSVVIKSEGSWTQKLNQILSSPASIDRLEVSVEGPYGPATTNFLKHDMLVMVSGGSGLTPFISITRELIAASAKGCKTPKVLLLCAFKTSSQLAMLDLLLPQASSAELSNLDIQIEAYVTRQKEPATQGSKQIRTVWLKPNAMDAPISASLGRNSWLWLAVIISSSFLMFLILLGIVTQYHIYPIDHNTNRIYSTTWKALLNILLICASIVITASGVFLWNKRSAARESNQIQSMEGSSPAVSPNSGWHCNADKEMESLPQQSLDQCTNVHYGERPDLKRLLPEIKEWNVGVLACGPKKLRHEVATICSSGLADNLHFESISFTW